MVHDRQPHACPAARLGGVSSWGTEPTGRNEGKPHRMSPEKSSPGVSRAATTSVKADDSLRRKPSAQGASGGVSVDSMSGSARRNGWEVCGGEGTQHFGQAGKTVKPEVAAAEVGVLHSSEEAPVMGVERRRDAWSGRQARLRLTAPQGDRLLRREVTHPDYGHGGNRRSGTRLGKPDAVNPFVRFDEGRSGNAALTTKVGLSLLFPLRLLY